MGEAKERLKMTFEQKFRTAEYAWHAFVYSSAKVRWRAEEMPNEESDRDKQKERN
jgi:hypothetical protein